MKADVMTSRIQNFNSLLILYFCTDATKYEMAIENTGCRLGSVSVTKSYVRTLRLQTILFSSLMDIF